VNWQKWPGAKVGDLKAVFAFLQSLPATANRVPDPAVKRVK
jgi:hypothetical protein